MNYAIITPLAKKIEAQVAAKRAAEIAAAEEAAKRAAAAAEQAALSSEKWPPVYEAPRPGIRLHVDRRILSRVQLALADKYVPNLQSMEGRSDAELLESARALENSASRILREVSIRHNITQVDLRSHRRPRFITDARQEFFYRMATETTWSLPQIGRWLGGFDHTTVLHGVRRHAGRYGLPSGEYRGRAALEAVEAA